MTWRERGIEKVIISPLTGRINQVHQQIIAMLTGVVGKTSASHVVNLVTTDTLSL